MGTMTATQKRVMTAIRLSGGEVCRFALGRRQCWALVDALGVERETFHPRTMAALAKRGLLRLKRFAHGGMVYALA